jgi:hypothetical protein
MILEALSIGVISSGIYINVEGFKAIKQIQFGFLAIQNDNMERKAWEWGFRANE